MNPISTILYGYSLVSFLQNRNSENSTPTSVNNIRALIDAKSDFLLTQRDLIHNLDYSDYIKIVDTRFWYFRMGSYFANCTLSVQNISSREITIYGVVIDWSILGLYSKSPLISLKPVIIKPGATEDIVLCTLDFEHLYDKDGKEVTITPFDLANSFDYKDKDKTISVESVVLLNTGLFVHLDNGQLVYRELKPYYSQIRINDKEPYNLYELKQYTGYSTKQGRANLNLIKLWKAKGYSGLPFNIPKDKTISEEAYTKATGEYKNVDEP